jgi:hypothetical protein
MESEAVKSAKGSREDADRALGFAAESYPQVATVQASVQIKASRTLVDCEMKVSVLSVCQYPCHNYSVRSLNFNDFIIFQTAYD